MDARRDQQDDSWVIPARKPEDHRLSFGGFLRSRFLTGAIVAFPLVVSVFFGRFVFDLIDRWADPISMQLFGRVVPGVGAAVFVLSIFMLGVLAHNVIGRRVLRLGDRLLGRIPVLRPIYRGAREVTRAFGSDRTKSFRRVVLIPFPVPGVWAIAFVTGEYELPSAAGGEKALAVYMPTTPNPTTGFYMLYPQSSVRETNMAVEEGIRVVISGGLVSAPQARLFPPDGRASGVQP
jgi:uncharacterized membrane protein